MPEWVTALTSAGVFAGGTVFLRELVIAVVSLWSLGKKKADRDYARELIKDLKPVWRRVSLGQAKRPEIQSRDSDEQAEP